MKKRKMLIAVCGLLLLSCSMFHSSPLFASEASASTEARTSYPTHMKEIQVTMVDIYGSPVGNLCVNLEYVDGPKGSYTPGDALTRYSTGATLRYASPAQYNVIVSDRDQLDYTGASQRNQMVFPISVTESGESSFIFIWDKPTPQEQDLAAKDKVTLTFLDNYGKPVRDLWVSIFPKDDKNPEPRQIVPGITDQYGRVYWTNYETGAFIGSALLITTDGDGPYIHGKDSISFEVTGPGEFTFIWEPTISE